MTTTPGPERPDLADMAIGAAASAAAQHIKAAAYAEARAAALQFEFQQERARADSLAARVAELEAQVALLEGGGS